MTEAPTPPAPKPELYRTKRFYVIVAGLVALTATPTLVYYAMGYNSVNGTVVELVTGRRGYSPGFFSTSATFYIEVHVWSYATSIDTRVSNPRFALGVDSFNLGTVFGTEGTFKPNGYVVYFLTFTTDDSAVARTIGQSSSNYLVLSMSALVGAGWYSEQVTKTDSATWTFSG